MSPMVMAITLQANVHGNLLAQLLTVLLVGGARPTPAERTVTIGA